MSSTWFSYKWAKLCIVSRVTQFQIDWSQAYQYLFVSIHQLKLYFCIFKNKSITTQNCPFCIWCFCIYMLIAHQLSFCILYIFCNKCDTFQPALMFFFIVLVKSLKSLSVLIQNSSATSWKRRLSIKPTFDVQWWFDLLFWNKFGSPKPLVHWIRLWGMP